MEQLNALASICESAERMPVYQKPTISYPTTNLTSSMTLNNYYLPALCNNYKATLNFPTPPVTPITTKEQQGQQNSSKIQSFSAGYNPILHCRRPINPVMRNIISYASYMQHLDETWPEKCSRRGSAVIRASLYSQIANCLKGGAATARFRYWVKKSGFFLIERLEADGNYAVCIAVPVNQNKIESDKSTKSYRLVAKLEEFVHLIGEYHNDTIGHYGIRKTYQMVNHVRYYLV
jgi:hypothetical protein